MIRIKRLTQRINALRKFFKYYSKDVKTQFIQMMKNKFKNLRVKILKICPKMMSTNISVLSSFNC